MEHGCMVSTELVPRQQQFHVAPAMPVLSTPLRWILKKCTVEKLVTHVESHASAVSLLKRAENSTIIISNHQSFNQCHFDHWFPTTRCCVAVWTNVTVAERLPQQGTKAYSPCHCGGMSLWILVPSSQHFLSLCMFTVYGLVGGGGGENIHFYMCLL